MSLLPNCLGSRAILPVTATDSALLTGGTVGTRVLTALISGSGLLWQVPVGVASIDVLAVGSGGDGNHLSENFRTPGGGGGGQITEVFGIPVTPLEFLQYTVADRTVNFAPATYLLRPPNDPMLGPWLARGITGAPSFQGQGGPSGSGVAPGGWAPPGGGGGGGGENPLLPATSGGGTGAGGNGGDGRNMSATWTTLYGQAGFFGGGGGGADNAGISHGAQGIGHGANAGGGGFALFDFGPVTPGDAGILLISYVAP